MRMPTYDKSRVIYGFDGDIVQALGKGRIPIVIFERI